MAHNDPGSFTRAEILSQPRVWEAVLEKTAALSPDQLPDLRSYQHVLFTGCGSTYYLSQWAARQCQQLTGIPASAAPASELLLFPSAHLRAGIRTLLVAVSRSAETTETVRAVEAFNAGGYGDVLAVSCYPERRMVQLARWMLVAPDAQERSIAQTRSFTSMLLMIAWLLNERQLPEPPGRLAAAASDLIARYGDLAEKLGHDAGIQRFFFLGSGPLYGLACEAGLKMKEMSLAYSEAYHFLEFRHGPMSMVDGRSLVVGLMSAQETGLELDVLRDMRALGARMMAIAVSEPDRISEAAGTVIGLPGDLPAVWRAPLYLPVLQLLAYHRARFNGLDPDRPTHLEAVVVLDT